MSERRTKTLTYKHIKFHESGPELKGLLEKALTRHDTVGARRQSLAPDGEPPIWRLIGQSSIEKEFIFGVLVQYVPGSNPVVLTDDESAKSITVEQMAVPRTDDGKRREPLEGMLFFAVIENHLVLMQSSALRADHLEKHLLWLLHHSKALEGTNTMQLMDSPPKQVREKMAVHKVKSLDFGGELLPASVFTAAQSDTNVSANTVATVTSVASHGATNGSSSGILNRPGF